MHNNIMNERILFMMTKNVPNSKEKMGCNVI